VAEVSPIYRAGAAGLAPRIGTGILRASGGLWLAGLPDFAAPVLLPHCWRNLALAFSRQDFSAAAGACWLGIAVKSWLGMAVLSGAAGVSGRFIWPAVWHCASSWEETGAASGALKETPSVGS